MSADGEDNIIFYIGEINKVVVVDANSKNEETPAVQSTLAADSPNPFPQDKSLERGLWKNKCDSILAVLGYAVGLGNIWRFPYLCYRNGGGAFLIPYFLFLFTMGMPIFFLELALGQFTSQGPLACWSMAPLFRGVGIAMVILSSIAGIYYNMILAWTIFYFFASMTNELPWNSCDNSWNTKDCYKHPQSSLLYGNSSNSTLSDSSSTSSPSSSSTTSSVYNNSQNDNFRLVLPSEEYLNYYVLHKSDTISEFGGLQWKLVLSLLGAWIIVFLCLIRGITASGKMLLVTATVPYVLLLILGIRGWSLPNAVEGIKYYMSPNLSRLNDSQVWKDAAVQMFFSLGTCGGSLITLASYTRFHNNCLKDAIFVSLVNFGTSILAGFVIFSYLGYLAGETNQPMDKIADHGPTLSFVVYPYAVTLLPISPFWSLLFFFMLFTLGIDSELASIETVVSSLLDCFPKLRPRKTLLFGSFCVLFFLLGLPLCASGGSYLVALMDNYVVGWPLLIIGFFECVCVGWVYGVRNFYNDLALMLGVDYVRKPLFRWWGLCWAIISPILLLFVTVFYFLHQPGLKDRDYEFPNWANVLGWFMSFGVVIWIVLWMIFQFFYTPGTIKEKLFQSIRPQPHWGPYNPNHRQLLHQVADVSIEPDTSLRDNLNAIKELYIARETYGTNNESNA